MRVPIPNGIRLIVAQDQRAFLGRTARKVCFFPGVEFYRLSEFELFGPKGTASPWWSAVKPLAADDPGLDGTLQRAAELGLAPSEYKELCPRRSGVTNEWNAMNSLLTIRLCNLFGGLSDSCAHQRMHDADKVPKLHNVVWIGGAWQAYLPNLTRKQAARI